MSADGQRMLAHFRQLDDRLAAAGYPKRSEWWDREFEAFYMSGRTNWIQRVGRGGAKSTYAARFGLIETLFGRFQIGRGERHYFTFVSENVSEALQRLRMLESYLTTLGVQYTRSGETIELQDLPRGFKVLACRVGAVSGWRGIGAACDEEGKWKSDTDSANAAEDVCTSLNAMAIVHPQAKMLHISSPLGMLDYHYQQFEEGTNERQYCSPAAASWVANPSITEADCRKRARSDRVFRREYAATPQAGAAGAFDVDAIFRAFRDAPVGCQLAEAIVVVDRIERAKRCMVVGRRRVGVPAGAVAALVHERQGRAF